MPTKLIDFLFISILAIGTGATVFLLSTSRKISSVLLASATSGVAGTYIVKSKIQLESKLNTLIAVFDRNQTSVQLENINFNSTTFAPITSSQFTLDTATNQQERQQIIQWLESLDIQVNNYYQPQSTDYIYDRLTITLGDNYQYLEKLYQQIKRNLSTGENFKLKLSDKDQQLICQNTSFCNQLYEYTFLSSYRYITATKTIVAAPNRKGEVINFFSGQWFERFVYLKVSQLLSYHDLDYQYLLNPEIVTPEGNNFELDIVFLINGEPLWIECKTGQYQNYIHKYSQFRKTLKVDKQRSFLVILGLSDRLAHGLTKMYDLVVSNENLFIQDINKILTKLKQTSHIISGVSSTTKLQPKIEATETNLTGLRRTIKIKPKTIQNRDELLTTLKKAKLRPTPAWRTKVLLQLIEIVNQDNYSPQLLKDIKEQLFLLMSGISKTILIEILNALIMAECLLDTDNYLVYSYHQNLNHLVSEKLEILEQKCLEIYALIICLTDPKYFTNIVNLEDFQTVVGTDSLDNLDLAKIQNLAERISNGDNPISTINFVL